MIGTCFTLLTGLCPMLPNYGETLVERNVVAHLPRLASKDIVEFLRLDNRIPFSITNESKRFVSLSTLKIFLSLNLSCFDKLSAKLLILVVNSLKFLNHPSQHAPY